MHRGKKKRKGKEKSSRDVERQKTQLKKNDATMVVISTCATTIKDLSKSYKTTLFRYLFIIIELIFHPICIIKPYFCWPILLFLGKMKRNPSLEKSKRRSQSSKYSSGRTIIILHSLLNSKLCIFRFFHDLYYEIKLEFKKIKKTDRQFEQ